MCGIFLQPAFHLKCTFYRIIKSIIIAIGSFNVQDVSFKSFFSFHCFTSLKKLLKFSSENVFQFLSSCHKSHIWLLLNDTKQYSFLVFELPLVPLLLHILSAHHAPGFLIQRDGCYFSEVTRWRWHCCIMVNSRCILASSKYLAYHESSKCWSTSSENISSWMIFIS